MDYTLFTDSQAAMRRITGDAPGPEQEVAVQVVEVAQRMVARGCSVTIRWTPAHRGVEGNEQAGRRAGDTVALPALECSIATAQIWNSS